MKIISGFLKGQTITIAKNPKMRPTTGYLRECVFNICQKYLVESRILDLFAGTGAMGIEAISRGASSATFVEQNRQCINALKQNLSRLDILDRAHIISGDVFFVLKQLIEEKKEFDIIFADPPYNTTTKHRSQKIFVSQLLVDMIDSAKLLSPDGIFLLEEGTDTPLFFENLKFLQLKNTRKISGTNLYQLRRK